MPDPEIVEAEEWLNLDADGLGAALTASGSRAADLASHIRRFQRLQAMAIRIASRELIPFEELDRTVYGSRITPPYLLKGAEVPIIYFEDQSADTRQREQYWPEFFVRGEAAIFGSIIHTAVAEKRIGRCQGFREGRRCNRLIIQSPTGRPRKYCDDNTCGQGRRRRKQ